MRCLLLEGYENADVNVRPVQYIDESNEMIWWSERSGWGHFYLYDREGKLKNPITRGAWRASRVVQVDEKTSFGFTGQRAGIFGGDRLGGCAEFGISKNEPRQQPNHDRRQ